MPEPTQPPWESKPKPKLTSPLGYELLWTTAWPPTKPTLTCETGRRDRVAWYVVHPWPTGPEPSFWLDWKTWPWEVEPAPTEVTRFVQTSGYNLEPLALKVCEQRHLTNRLNRGEENPMFLDVQDFMRAGGQAIGDRAKPEPTEVELRARLVFEEALEFVTACGFEVYDLYDDEQRTVTPALRQGEVADVPSKPDFIGTIDALCDLLYVVFGTFVTWGLNPVPFWKEVHRSNMSKVGSDMVTLPNGKIGKPASYSPPDLARVLQAETDKEKIK